MRPSPYLLFALAIALGAGCEAAEESSTPSSPSNNDHEVSVQPQGTAGAIDSTTQLQPTRYSQRIALDVLQASIPIVAGNDVTGEPIRWRVNGQDALDDEVFGQTLGRPDFVSVSNENPAPSSLYVKFVRDMSQDVCDQMVKNDLLRSSSDPATLWRLTPIDGSATSEQINENIAYLNLRFTGMRVATTDPVITALRVVFDAGEQSASGDNWSGAKPAAEGWRAVCLALFESGAFHID